MIVKKREEEILTNTELKKLLEKALIRFQNWKLQVETNPNPRMVHSLKNIVAIIDSISSISEQKCRYSYKMLSRHMAKLINEIASLNMVITDSLEADDFIDEKEEEKIIASLFRVIQSATDLIRITQEGFGLKKRISIEKKIPVITDQSNG